MILEIINQKIEENTKKPQLSKIQLINEFNQIPELVDFNKIIENNVTNIRILKDLRKKFKF